MLSFFEELQSIDQLPCNMSQTEQDKNGMENNPENVTYAQQGSQKSSRQVGSIEQHFKETNNTNRSLPYPPMEMRRRGKKGSQRPALEVINVAFSQLSGNNYDPKDDPTNKITESCAKMTSWEDM